MKSVEVLTKARELISDPAKWTQGASAKNRDGKVVGLMSDDAECFCLIGAIDRITLDGEDADNDTAWAGAEAYRLTRDAIGGGAISEWNDEPKRTHADVISALDAAIEKAKAQS